MLWGLQSKAQRAVRVVRGVVGLCVWRPLLPCMRGREGGMWQRFVCRDGAASAPAGSGSGRKENEGGTP